MKSALNLHYVLYSCCLQPSHNTTDSSHLQQSTRPFTQLSESSYLHHKNTPSTSYHSNQLKTRLLPNYFYFNKGCDAQYSRSPYHCKTTKQETGVDHNIRDKDDHTILELYASDTKVLTNDVVPGKGAPPEPPTNCCMSGCANCVWIEYSDELKIYYSSDGAARAREQIQQIEDPNLRAYLLLEIS